MATDCDCVGYVLLTLDGAHGWVRGRYGLAADQLLAGRLVLANGTTIEVSQTQKSDLSWALYGTGRNLGIVS